MKLPKNWPDAKVLLDEISTETGFWEDLAAKFAGPEELFGPMLESKKAENMTIGFNHRTAFVCDGAVDSSDQEYWGRVTRWTTSLNTEQTMKADFVSINDDLQYGCTSGGTGLSTNLQKVISETKHLRNLMLAFRIPENLNPSDLGRVHKTALFINVTEKAQVCEDFTERMGRLMQSINTPQFIKVDVWSVSGKSTPNRASGLHWLGGRGFPWQWCLDQAYKAGYTMAVLVTPPQIDAILPPASGEVIITMSDDGELEVK